MADDISAAIRVSVVSVAWTIATGATAVVLGIVASSIVLVAFGLTAAVDAAGSWLLALHFRHVRHHDRIDARRERRAHVVINLGLLVIGSGAVIESGVRLLQHHGSRGSRPGALTAAASVIALTALAIRKHKIARRLGSAPWHADGNLSATGALLGAVTVVGALVHGIDWLDPVCAAGIGAVAAASGGYSLASHDDGG